MLVFVFWIIAYGKFSSSLDAKQLEVLQLSLERMSSTTGFTSLLFICLVHVIAMIISVMNDAFPALKNYGDFSRACSGGYFEVAKLLLEKGADGAPNSFTGITPLYAACLSGNVELVRLLAHAMPQTINMPGKMDKTTALHVAADVGSEEIIKILLQVPK